MLHYVGLIAPESTSLPLPWPASQCQELAPGFNRLSFSGGQVLLTLCVGELKPMLRAQNFAADSIFLSPGQSPATSPVWDDWTIQALMRCCRRGTELTAHRLAAPEIELFVKHGFEIEPGNVNANATAKATAQFKACFNPRWQIQSTRRHLNLPAAPASNCVVIGAGLAGAGARLCILARQCRLRCWICAAGGLDGGTCIQRPQRAISTAARGCEADD
jgi:tRNA 5-methylaminomethyl-2-thiouridine biosynthesis bifunctional protein